MTRFTAFLAMLACAIHAPGCATPSMRASNVSASAKRPHVRFETTLGDFVVELDIDKAPKTVANFARYVDDGFYNETIFHRVLSDELIQGGAYTPEMELKTSGLRPGVQDASVGGAVNERGTIVMYKVLGKRASAQAQFYINVAGNPSLDEPQPDGSSYTVFGTVVEGMETIDRIGGADVDTHPKYAAGFSPVVPISPVIVRRAELLGGVRARDVQQELEAHQAAAERRAEETRQLALKQLRERVAEIEHATNASLTTTESGLKYVDIIVGNGAPPEVFETVVVHYRGTFADGTEFENTYSRDKPVERVVDSFIPGLREGIITMFEGGKRIFIVPPELAFGDRGLADIIPPDSILIFELELLAIK